MTEEVGHIHHVVAAGLSSTAEVVVGASVVLLHSAAAAAADLERDACSGRIGLAWSGYRMRV